MRLSVKLATIAGGTVIALYALTVAGVWGAAWILDFRQVNHIGTE